MHCIVFKRNVISKQTDYKRIFNENVNRIYLRSRLVDVTSRRYKLLAVSVSFRKKFIGKHPKTVLLNQKDSSTTNYTTHLQPILPHTNNQKKSLKNTAKLNKNTPQTARR